MKSFTFLPFQNLESERLILRKMTHKDVDQVFALRSNPDNMQFIPRPLLKNNEYFEGKFWDSVIYAILKSECNFKNIIE
ncbi:hypothetical protein BWK59_12605 [Flavobacterium davisii]|uniref:Uncharacterized protein n=1 Tax=Flavobacterium davisii TaxID=2906077 RepID=A0A246GFV6_9FLAO|nr:GNAT family N-acetyltransferase [Flavobacterium davisii]OWP83043.1 hypothetical protein BWK59_12605 [Flavobacterium davisii]